MQPERDQGRAAKIEEENSRTKPMNFNHDSRWKTGCMHEKNDNTNCFFDAGVNIQMVNESVAALLTMEVSATGWMSFR